MKISHLIQGSGMPRNQTLGLFPVPKAHSDKYLLLKRYSSWF